MEHCLLKQLAATFAVGAFVALAQPAEAAVTAVLNGTTLEVDGDGADDTITLRLEFGNPANLQVFDGATLRGTFAIAGLTAIDVDGGAGVDTILVDEANGAIAVGATAADFLLAGGDGDDTITGGSDAETLNGGNNNDTLLGRGGTDILNGNDGNDTLTGGPGGAPTPGNFEPHNGGIGDDTFIWFNGDGSDIVEGGDGNDTQRFDGNVTNADVMNAAPGAVVGRVLFTRVAGNINMDIGTTENLIANGLGGDDLITLQTGLNGLILITVNGGDGNDNIAGGDGPDVLNGDAGNDIITGGAGTDVLNGGEGNDTLTGNQGAVFPAFETHNGGPGDDTMIWNNGDGSDIQEGGEGNDTSIFNGNAAATDVMNALAGAVAGRVAFTRQAANINMDIGTTEILQVNSLGGDDQITVQASLANLITLLVDSGAGADTINAFLPAPFTLNGNTELDTLNFDAQGQTVQLLPNEVRSGNVTRVAHTNVETVNVLNSSGAAPTITITSPTADPTFVSTAPVLALSGTAADAEGIQSITFTNDRGGSGAATGTTSWSANVPLAAGANLITVTVTDTNGNSASDILTVTVDELTYTLAEGATGSFFDTDILIANPTATPAPVTITYLKGDGTTVPQTLTIAPTSRQTILVDNIAGLDGTDVSATVVSTDAVPLVVERTMRWDPTGYGAHTEKATGGPTLNWFFAEGSQGFFQTFVLLANPNPTANRATVTFLREGNAPPVTETFNLLPTSRTTIFAGDIPALRDQSFGIQVVFDSPGVAERAMYFGTRVFEAGHESAGVNAPATEWFLAEGATGSFFTTFLLVANPGDTDANVTYTYLPDTGLPIVKTRTVAARTRWTGNIATEDPSLANAAVATRITSTQPVIAERAQYWPFTPDQWYEAHNSFGTTSLGTKWGLAEGRVGTAANYQTFILLANPSTTTAAQVTATFLRTNGTTVTKTYTVEPTSRFNIEVNGMVPELANETFGTRIEVTNGVGIAVERAMYSDSAGVPLAAGTNALGTQLP